VPSAGLHGRTTAPVLAAGPARGRSGACGSSGGERAPRRAAPQPLRAAAVTANAIAAWRGRISSRGALQPPAASAEGAAAGGCSGGAAPLSPRREA